MSSSRLKPKKLPKRCIFCGGNKVTGEHLWPDWAAPLFADRPMDTVASEYGEGPWGTPLKMDRRTRQGRVTQMRIYAVCGACNNGWMSELETATKPILTTLSKSDAFELDPNGQTVLARWITLKMMVADNHRRDQAVFPDAALQSFHASGIIPDGLGIWLFRCGEGIWRSAYFRQTLAISVAGRHEVAEVMNLGPPPRNTKAIALGFNDLFVYANFSVLPNIKLEVDADAAGRRLWPPTGSFLVWPPRFMIDPNLATHIAYTLERAAITSRVTFK
jgi:hypothetical protein